MSVAFGNLTRGGRESLDSTNGHLVLTEEDDGKKRGERKRISRGRKTYES